MNRIESKAGFIALELIELNVKYAKAFSEARTQVERMALAFHQAASLERIKQIHASVPAACFKRDSIGIDKRRYKRHLRKNKGLVVKVNIEAQSSNQAARDSVLG
jgi:RecA/RadA recombinase